MGHEHTIGMGHISCIFLAGAPGRILSGVVGFRVWGLGLESRNAGSRGQA